VPVGSDYSSNSVSIGYLRQTHLQNVFGEAEPSDCVYPFGLDPRWGQSD
jgi:hypothetical protein